MPVLLPGGAMSIVAHADDDLLFMNPDIANGIAAGDVSVTVFVTAGDAGYQTDYWQSREAGIKAAYALMAGAADWVDETLEITYGGGAFEIATSHLQSAPEVRLYFLRVPDGAGVIEDPADYEALARLEDGTRAMVDTIDGANTFSRDALVHVLTGIMDAHMPELFRLQVAEGAAAAGEHTDHIHATEFALEALRSHAGTSFQVNHYVNYQTDDMPVNLSAEEAAFALEVMRTYAAFDFGVTDEFGTLLPRFEAWTARQYIDESYSAQEFRAAPALPEPEPAEEGGTPGIYALGASPDDGLFQIDAETGEINPRDWFVPSLDDAWDTDGDHVYEITRISRLPDRPEPVVEVIRLMTTAEGVLTRVDESLAPPDSGAMPLPGPVPDTPPDRAVVYSLGTAPDNALFIVDPQRGDIARQDWFIPSLDDAWDADENFVYEVTRIATPTDGGTPVSEMHLFATTAEGELTRIDAPSGSDETRAGPGDEDPPTAAPDGNDDPPAAGSGVTFSLGTAPDNTLFEIDPLTGAIAPRDWFVPSLGDAWDENDDFIYELTRLATPNDGTAPVRETILLQTTAEGVLTALVAPSGGDASAIASVPETPVETAPLPATSLYALSGPDEFLFEVDRTSGEISRKDWFIPTRDDAWDADEDHIYRVTRIERDADGVEIARLAYSYETSPADAFVLISVTEEPPLA